MKTLARKITLIGLVIAMALAMTIGVTLPVRAYTEGYCSAAATGAWLYPDGAVADGLLLGYDGAWWQCARGNWLPYVPGQASEAGTVDTPELKLLGPAVGEDVGRYFYLRSNTPTPAGLTVKVSWDQKFSAPAPEGVTAFVFTTPSAPASGDNSIWLESDDGQVWAMVRFGVGEMPPILGIRPNPLPDIITDTGNQNGSGRKRLY